ncbi:hypothetical protein QUF72_01000 [Desulfobacterales bacterium HSG2]|nr:hypothetical protein [Desulfobacterales bacterium HSG2]
MKDIKENPVCFPGETEQPIYSEDGVDLTLIRWMLSLTPAERLQVLQQQILSISKLKNGTRRTNT